MPSPLEIPTETFSVVDVDPVTAEYWLDNYNNHNRGLRMSAVNRYARDMRAGRWLFNGEAIMFDTDPKLQNGQHRLKAVIKSDTTQRFLIVTGLDPKAQDSMDAGVKRNPGDVLELAGFGSQSQNLAAVTRLVLTMEHQAGEEHVRLSRGFTTGEIRARIERDPALQYVVNEAVPSLNLPKSLVAKNVAAYCYYRLAQIDAGQAHQFFESLVTLENLPRDSPIIALHRRLTAHTTMTGKSKEHQLEAIAYIMSAWNAWRLGERREYIRLPVSQGDRRIRIPAPR